MKEEREKEDNLLNKCKFLKPMLPILVITKFDGTYFDWFKFWNQFQSQIDKCDLPQVSKFSYLTVVGNPKGPSSN